MKIVTRIVTCYRQWDHLEKWFFNVALHQAHVAWIVVNDSPLDAPGAALRRLFEDRSVLLLTPPCNLGRSRARNLGAARAETPLLEFVDGDDIPLPLPERIDPAVSFHLFPVQEFNDGETPPSPSEDMDIRAQWTPLFKALAPIDVRPAGTMVSRELFRSVEGFDARFESAEDLDLCLRLQDRSPLVFRHRKPKQLYRVTKLNHNADPLHIEGHRKLWSRLKSEKHPASPVIQSWTRGVVARRWLCCSRDLFMTYFR